MGSCMFNCIVKDKSLFQFIIINLITFGWMCAIPIMLEHVEKIALQPSFFYTLMTISAVVSIFINFACGKAFEVFGSRGLILIGIVLNILFWFLLTISSTKEMLIVSFIVEGLSFSALLIARAPYCFDFLKSKGFENDYAKIESESKFLMLFLMVCLLSFSGYLYEINPMIPFIINTLMALACFILVYWYRDVCIPNHNSVQEGNQGIFMKLKELYQKERSLFYLATSEGLYSGITSYVIFIVFYHVTFLGADVVYLSTLTMCLYVFRMLGTLLAKNNISERYIMSLYLSFIISLAFIGLSKEIYIVFAVYLFTAYVREFIEIHLIIKVTKTTPDYFMSAVRSYSETLANTSLLGIMIFLSYYLEMFMSATWMYLFAIWFMFCLYFYFLSIRSPIDASTQKDELEVA
jgi:MFS family permease